MNWTALRIVACLILAGFAYAETGWATALLLVFVLIRGEIMAKLWRDIAAQFKTEGWARGLRS